MIMWVCTEHMFSFTWHQKWAQTEFPPCVKQTRETTWTHLLSIGQQFYFTFNQYSSYTDFSSPSASLSITKQKRTKSLNHFQNKNLLMAVIILNLLLFASIVLSICKPIWVSDPEILVGWFPDFGGIPRLSLTSITRTHVLLLLYSVTHFSHCLSTFERGISYILSHWNGKWHGESYLSRTGSWLGFYLTFVVITEGKYGYFTKAFN